MNPIHDEREFGSEDRENEPGAESLDSAEDIEDPERSESNEDPADAELAEFTAAEWNQQFPGYAEEDFEEKTPERGATRRIVLLASCVVGAVFAATISGLIVDHVPAAWQLRTFLILFVVLAPGLSIAGHWFFITRPDRIISKLEEEEKLSNSGPGPIHPE
jgi:hypothetical protein